MTSFHVQVHALALCVTWLMSYVVSHDFQLGVVAPFSGDWPIGRTAGGAVLVALNDIRNDPDLRTLRNAGHSFSVVWADTQCQESKGLGAVVDLWANNGSGPGIDAFIGPACDAVCVPAASLATVWTIPMISFTCGAESLSNKHRYPTFARTVAPLSAYAPFVCAIMEYLNWKRIIIITSEEYVWQTTANSIQRTLYDKGFRAGVKSVFFEMNTRTQREHAVQHQREIISQLINVHNFQVFLLSINGRDVVDFMIHAKALGLLNGHHAFITIEFELPSGAGKTSADWYGLGECQCVWDDLFDGILDVSLHIPHGNRLDDKVPQALSDYKGNLPFDRTTVNQSLLNIFAYSMYDAVWLYALAVNDSLAEGVDPTDRKNITQRLFNRTFEGKQGKLHINEHGDARPMFSLRNRRKDTWVIILDYFMRYDQMEITVSNNTIIWPGGITGPLLDNPSCSPGNKRCREDSSKDVYVAVSVCFVLVMFVIALAFVINYKRKILKAASIEWKIKYDDIAFTTSRKHQAMFRQFGYSRSQSFKSSLNLSISSEGTLLQDQLFTRVGQYTGKVVAIRLLKKPFVAVTAAAIQDITSVRQLRHANINQLVGACVEPNRVCLVTSYCSKGSLMDVLENHNIKLDRIFKLSFASDIASGMVYLHQSPVHYHGRLKSTNVLIDSRWTAKLTDMGLWAFREGERFPTPTEYAYSQQLLWTAPEHLREDDVTRRGSQKGDVYGYAIILQEIVLRTGPFGNMTDEPKVIIDRVRRGEHPPLRPKVVSEDADDDLLDLMRICWEEIPVFRPSFTTIRDSFRKLNKGRQLNLVDQMMLMMERYADNLEDIVEERTRLLAEEQRKTEDLVARMLPKSVAEKLKRGQAVQPENYSHVTIFFSDIVGFTSMAALSTPFQVIEILNDLYTCFDTVIDNYDVYKVETIGDAYMVVSGLPVRNGRKHAGEICTMALHLLSHVYSFRIRHMPERQLQLRIGIHTGPAAAGVVGMKMPRYCLFGDTVNYASRMETNGLALHIHISPECKETLDELGGYHLVKRGLVYLKGKGRIQTYFLTGKDNFDRVPTDFRVTASPENDEKKEEASSP